MLDYICLYINAKLWNLLIARNKTSPWAAKSIVSLGHCAQVIQGISEEGKGHPVGRWQSQRPTPPPPASSPQAYFTLPSFHLRQLMGSSPTGSKGSPLSYLLWLNNISKDSVPRLKEK